MAGDEATTSRQHYEKRPLGRHVGWNFGAIALDMSFWSAGVACVDPGAVLPVFVSTLTGSKLAIAVLTILPGVGWTLPQLMGVARVIHRRRKKKYLLKTAALGRTPMLLLPLLLLLFPSPPRALVLWALVGCYGLLFLTDGLLGAAWYDIVGKTIPSQVRGRFFGTTSILGGLGALGSGWLVKRALASPHLPYPREYGVLFAAMCAGLYMSYLMLAMIREPEGSVISEQIQPFREVLAQVSHIWRSSAPLRRLLAVSWLGSITGLGWPFYVLYGMQALRLPAESGAVFIWATSVGSIGGSVIWAWVNDRKGPRSVVAGVSAMRLIPPALALFVPILATAFPLLRSPGPVQYVYAIVFLMAGVVASGGMMGFSNYLLELAPEEERPLFAGLDNTLSACGLLAPVLGGWLASVWSYPAVFAVGAVVGVGGLLASLGLVDPVAENHLPPYSPSASVRAPD